MLGPHRCGVVAGKARPWSVCSPTSVTGGGRGVGDGAGSACEGFRDIFFHVLPNSNPWAFLFLCFKTIVVKR